MDDLVVDYFILKFLNMKHPRMLLFLCVYTIQCTCMDYANTSMFCNVQIIQAGLIGAQDVDAWLQMHGQCTLCCGPNNSTNFSCDLVICLHFGC